MADLFVDRFDNKSLAACYAAFNIFIALFTLGVGNLAAFKVASAMVVKNESAFTAEERQNLADYREYRTLKSQVDAGALAPDLEPFKTLDQRNRAGLLHSSFSYLSPLPFYVGYSLIVCIYISLGGLKAAVIANAVQGLLIILMSVLIIPMGLVQAGGFHGLHQKVPDFMFQLTSDSTWYSVAIIVLCSLLQVIGIIHNMSTGGSARNEDAARWGMLSGGFTKRLVIVAWIFCGLLAVGLLSGTETLSDPDGAWGALSVRLLPVGMMGLMLSGMLLGHMPVVGVYSVSVAGLATRQFYEPLFPGRSPRHYLLVGKFSIVLVMAAGIALAMMFSDLTNMWAFMIRYGIYFGAAVWLLIFWRRVTAAGIMTGFIVWILGIVLLPTVLGHVDSFRTIPSLLRMTERYSEMSTVRASAADVKAGKAQEAGQLIHGERLHDPIPVYFDAIVPLNPGDPNSPMRGEGRFNIELYTLHFFGLPVTRLHKADKDFCEWLFDSLLPFAVIILASLATDPGDPLRADRFYAKMRTPVGETPEEDKRQIELSNAEPHRFDDTKLFRNSQWQFVRWTKKDYFGFFGCWLIAGAIMAFLWGVLHAGS
jgi:SSS family solute:Na+ symporter